MPSIYHANAKTTLRIRKEIQNSKETINELAKYNINFKTLLRWKHSASLQDKKSGPTIPQSKVLTQLQEIVICEFRRQTKLPLDDILICLKNQIPKLTQSNLYRCLKRHKLNVLPKQTIKKNIKKKFKEYNIGFVHIDITEVRIADKQKQYLFVAIDRVCKYAYVECYDRMTKNISEQFLKNTIAYYPFRIHTILTDNGTQFTYSLLAKHLKPKNKSHPFDEICIKHNIKHKLTEFKHPWTNGQVEVLNKKIKEYTTKKYHYDTLTAFKKHLISFLLMYNYEKKLKALKYLSPYDKLLEIYNSNSILFKENPFHKKLGLNK